MEPDYKNQNLVELYDIKEHIDERLYPERYKRLLDEITIREQNPEGEPEPYRLSKSDKIVILKVIMVLSAIFFSWRLVNAFQTGVIESRGGHEYYLATNPSGFYFFLALYFFFLLFSLCVLFKSGGKNT